MKAVGLLILVYGTLPTRDMEQRLEAAFGYSGDGLLPTEARW